MHISSKGTLMALTFDLGVDLNFVQLFLGASLLCIHMTEIAQMQIYTCVNILLNDLQT